MLQPNEQWNWELNEAGQLTLDLGENMLFQTPYKRRFLSEIIQQQAMSFSVEDAAFYERFMESLHDFSQWSPAEKVQLALNATAVMGFYKPLMPKSWFYKENPTPSFAMLELCSVVQLQTKFESGTCLVIDDTDNVVTALLLDQKLMIDDHNEVNQFEVIKVMKNRVFDHFGFVDANSEISSAQARVANY